MRSAARGPVDRALRRLGGSPTFARLAPKAVTAVDRMAHRLTGGRLLPGRWFVPTLMLTTTGARSGRPHQVPLAYVTSGDALYVVGSNFGRRDHPVWSRNLLQHPRARVTVDRQDVEVEAHLLPDDEKAEIWPKLLEIWPAYESYAERSGRDFRLFRLDRLS